MSASKSTETQRDDRSRDGEHVTAPVRLALKRESRDISTEYGRSLTGNNIYANPADSPYQAYEFTNLPLEQQSLYADSRYSQPTMY